MEGLALLIFLAFFVSFGIPVILLIIGLAQRRKNKDKAKVYFIIGTIWLIVGGGTCLSILTN